MIMLCSRELWIEKMVMFIVYLVIVVLVKLPWLGVLVLCVFV